MKFIQLMLFTVLTYTTSVFAADIAVPANPDQGSLFPITVEAQASEEAGNKILSFGADIWQSVVQAADSVKTELNDSWFKWSYNRGVGTIPNQCPAGFENKAGSCVQSCPADTTDVGGVCWQSCPDGFSDSGAVCTSWKTFKSVAKQSFVAERTGTVCATGMQNEAGLCYEPCADTFTGVGPFCFGQMNKAADKERVLEQVAAQHETAADNAPAGGIALAANDAPQLRTHVIFTPIMCAMDGIDGALGILPDPMSLGGMAVDAAGDGIVGAIANAVDQGGVSFIPTIANTVLFDFTADARCEDDGVVSKASLALNPSVTVKVSTSLFDPVLHNLAGVDLGIMQLSLYELIPFRIYGTVGTTIGAPISLDSEIDRTLPALIVDNQQFATRSAFNAAPSADFWLSTDAQIRVTSFLSFIPDLLQVGAEFKLHVLENVMPYRLEEGLRASNVGYELYRQESLKNELKAGHGYVHSYLRVLGINLDVLGDKASIDWEGHSQEDSLLNNETATPIAI